MELTAQTHLEADPEAGLHDLTHRLVGEMSPDRCEQQRPEDLRRKQEMIVSFRLQDNVIT